MKRLEVLRALLMSGGISTQEELAKELRRQSFEVTQSTISRDLRRLGAIKALDSSGRTVYRLPGASETPHPVGNLKDHIRGVRHNGALIVIHTTPGSAMHVARRLGQLKPFGILGALAGDDALFVVPESMKKIEETVQSLLDGIP